MSERLDNKFANVPSSSSSSSSSQLDNSNTKKNSRKHNDNIMKDIINNQSKINLKQYQIDSFWNKIKNEMNDIQVGKNHFNILYLFYFFYLLFFSKCISVMFQRF